MEPVGSRDSQPLPLALSVGAAGGAMTGPVSYTYTRGPDGKNDITGGEVPISVSSGKTPQETISRMQQMSYYA